METQSGGSGGGEGKHTQEIGRGGVVSHFVISFLNLSLSASHTASVVQDGEVQEGKGVR